MAEFTVGRTMPCVACERPIVMKAKLGDSTVSVVCPHCGEDRNYFFIDNVWVRVGQRLVMFAQNLLEREEFDFAAVVLVSALDASLSRGIIELSNWREVERLAPPLAEEALQQKLLRSNFRQKVEWFQSLAEATLADELQRLIDTGKVQNPSGTTFDDIRRGCEVVQEERNRFIHYGHDVDAERVRSSLPWVSTAVLLLDSLFFAAFHDRRNRPMDPG